MPAILEVQETPPNPLARWLGRMIILLFVILVVWSYFGKVNVVATARGQLVVRDNVDTVYLPDNVQLVHVNEGQSISKAQPLFSTKNTDGETSIVTANSAGIVVLIAHKGKPRIEIVTGEKELVAHVFLDNKDVGFVETGMPAEIKIDTFPFTKFGTIKSEILSIEAPFSQVRGSEPVFPLISSLSNDSIDVNGQPKKLIEGMAVTVEIQLGTRRVIEFFMSPLLRYQNDSLKER